MMRIFSAVENTNHLLLCTNIGSHGFCRTGWDQHDGEGL